MFSTPLHPFYTTPHVRPKPDEFNPLLLQRRYPVRGQDSRWSPSVRDLFSRGHRAEVRDVYGAGLGDGFSSRCECVPRRRLSEAEKLHVMTELSRIAVARMRARDRQRWE